ncbi:hypothetical protein F511_03500 [Dorcoceras hygrometricum]|uniref:Uncharacterized protein n=1 Tax=Dorcoceras hygrometricum TaxID=472368 RepID=A0A2Z7ARU7_9LAMI|nr:hypothetical protein F511_03500 [Dorcoceras hygrometricum]
MTFRVLRTNQYNQDLGLIHSTNGNHLESPNEGSSIDHQVTIYLHAQNITMFPTNETWGNSVAYVSTTIRRLSAQGTAMLTSASSHMLRGNNFVYVSVADGRYTCRRGNKESELLSVTSIEQEKSVNRYLLYTIDAYLLTDSVPSPRNNKSDFLRISTHDKGKEPLEEDEPVKGNPARETVELICGDVDFLVQLRDHVMKDVVEFFHSFSLNKLSDLDALRDLKEKEKLMLDWAETDSLETAVRRKMYILAKYREMLLRKFLDSHRRYFAPGQPWTAMASQIIDLLSVAHSKSLEDLLAKQKEHGIITYRPSSSQLFKDLADNSGAVLAQFYSMAKSTCWRPTPPDDQVEAVRQRNEFRAQAQQTLNIITDQLNELVAYINRGDIDKKGEGSSSRPQPPPDDQGGSSGGRGTGDNVRTTSIVERLISADRERERSRGNSSGSYKRRRY